MWQILMDETVLYYLSFGVVCVSVYVIYVRTCMRYKLMRLGVAFRILDSPTTGFLEKNISNADVADYCYYYCNRFFSLVPPRMSSRRRVIINLFTRRFCSLFCRSPQS